MKKLNLLFFALILVISSCSKKDSSTSTNTTPPQTCVLATMSKGGYSETYVYNAAGQLTKRQIKETPTGNMIEDTLSYDSKGRLWYIVLTGVGNYRVLTYNTAGNLTQITEYSNYSQSANYTYSTTGQGQITTVYYHDKTSTMDHTILVYDGNGNVTKSTDYDANGNTLGYTKYVYDNKNNNYNSYFKFMYSAISFANWGQNNCTSIVVCDPSGSPLETDTYKYTYGSNNYPLTSSLSTTTGITENDTYTYNCHN